MLQEIEKFQKGEGKDEEKYIDVVINKNMKLGQKVLIPVKQFPKDYDDGYGTAYDEQSYDSYDNSYSTPAQSGADYYDYGHGLSEETYDSYGQEEWTSSRHKAPSARTAKGVYREQPYGRY
ncbi:KH RNA binding domain containing, signal transduction associated 3 [Rhinolophus ferrumequinum]|uniref:KH RNA binding domain containing, signal transduction associated 3 n=1 Tax=Rhinolophus ferrumequinum TaxID=59479 RepID=A0A7J7VDY0_RHIFE|nr:KH RNA binding domain containing, signal transduction associated 3 [Rhinolophus ferrumequinum]